VARDERSADRAVPEIDSAGVNLALVCARFNDRITTRLLDGAERRLGELAIGPDRAPVFWVPGAFEIPFAAKQLALTGRVDAVVALGAVIRGETGHYDFVAGECARGIQQAQLDTGVPIIFGVLTTDTVEQALARSDVDGDDKGAQAIDAAVEMARFLQDVWSKGNDR
jgi:6,7-dimethyl-8-ribityllumazine synthase